MNHPRTLLNVVSIGGGNGLACLLKGLKHHVLAPSDTPRRRSHPWIAGLTAIVTVTDDGGSSGRLRDELQVLPPGDIRNCLVALSRDESLLSHLFQYRFPGTGELQGHSFGNLFLAALTGVTGDFLRTVQLSSEVLAIRGRILPLTLQDVKLVAKLADGSRVRGESAISRSRSRIQKLSLSPANCRPVPAVLHAIREADLITLGPGSLFTSLLPNLLVRGIVEEILKSSALKIYIGNLMTQPGETKGFTALEHLRVLREHAGANIFDVVILNTKPIRATLIARYGQKGAEPVVYEREAICALGMEIYGDALVTQEKAVRHDPALLAAAVYNAYQRWRVVRP